MSQFVNRDPFHTPNTPFDPCKQMLCWSWAYFPACGALLPVFMKTWREGGEGDGGREGWRLPCQVGRWSIVQHRCLCDCKMQYKLVI